MTTGPDVPAIQCYVPDGCCGPSPCDITEDQFICAVRTLLPEGDPWNTTLPTLAPETQVRGIGAMTVGCSLVGCEQMVFGSCCEAVALPCDAAKVAPQVAIIDSFAAVAYTALQSLCAVLGELDPCTSTLFVRCWGARFGLVTSNLCDRQWSDGTLKALLCEMMRIRTATINWDYLTALAARFGASITISAAGDMNCGPIGWWTMARNVPECPDVETCPKGIEPQPFAGPWMRLVPTCEGGPDSLNLVLGPTDISPPPNCNLPAVTLPHDAELYDALKWLLPRILPRTVFWCIYERNELACIV